MHRIQCDRAVQTDAGTHSEQCTQVIIDQSTEWTQCIVSQTDHSVQAVCKQSPATVQVAPETSDAAIQTSPAVTEPSSRVNEEKFNDDHYQTEEESSALLTNNRVSFSSAAKPSTEIVNKSRNLIDYPSSGEETEGSAAPKLQEQHNIPTTRANSISTLVAQSPVTSATNSAVIEQLPTQYVASEIPAVVQSYFPPTSVSGTCRRAVLQAAISMNTSTKYVYSFEQQTSVMRDQSLSYGRSHVASTQNIPTQHSVQTPLPCNTLALVTESAACQSLNVKPLFETNTASSDETASKMDSCHATVTDGSLAVKPLVPTLHADEACGSNQPSAELQQSVFTLSNDSSSIKSQTDTGQETTGKKLTPSALLPHVCDVPVIQNASLPVTKDPESANVNISSHSEELVVNESNQQRVQIISQIANTTVDKFPANAIILESDSDKTGDLKQNEKVLECDDMAISTREQSSTGENQSIHTSTKNNGVSCISNLDVTTAWTDSACVDSRAESSKQNMAAVQTQIDSNQAGSGDCTVTRGRSRRSLYICKGPLMETVTTLEGSASKSPHSKLQRDSQTSSRKLPAMLLGMF